MGYIPFCFLSSRQLAPNIIFILDVNTEYYRSKYATTMVWEIIYEIIIFLLENKLSML